MTTHPNTLDRGVPIKDRLWPLNTPAAHLPANFRREDVNTIQMLSVRNVHTGRLTAFDEFARANPVASNTESMLQLFIRSAQHFRNTYQSSKGEGWQNPEFPLKVYLEVVVESDAMRAERLTAAAAPGNPAFGARHEILREVLGASPTEMNRLTHAQSGNIDPRLTTFMSEVGDRHVVEYRLWFMCCSEGAVGKTFDKCMIDMLHQAFNWRVKHVLPTTIECEDKERVKRRSLLMANGELKSHMNKPSAVVGDNERWMVFETIEAYCHYLATYTRNAGYRHETVVQRCLAGNADIRSPENPANPNNVFHPALYFAGEHANVYSRQADITNYCELKPSNKSVWKFPLPTCVIEVPTMFLEVGTFCQKMTPDYQARVVQPRLSTRYFPPIGPIEQKRLFEHLLESAIAYNAATGSTGLPGVSNSINSDVITRDEMDSAFKQGEQPGYDTPEDDDVRRQLSAAEEQFERDENELPGAPAAPTAPLSDRELHASQRKIMLAKKKHHEQIMERYNARDPSTKNDWPKTAKTSTADAAGGGGLNDDNSRLGFSAVSGVSSSSSNATLLHDETSNGARSRLTAADEPDDRERQGLAQFDYGDSASRKQDREVNEFGTGGDTTALQTMKEHYTRHVLPMRRKIKEPLELALQYTADQDAIFNEFSLKCCSSSSSVSAAGAAINAFMEKCGVIYDDFLRVSYVIVDPRLSLFATFISQLMLDFNSLFGVFSAHREALTAVVAMFNTPWHQYALHLCVLLIGEAAVSKSYLIEMINRIGIEGTIKMINGQTAAARNISGNRDDMMDAYQEMNAGYLVESKQQGAPEKNKEHDQFKERIGTCQVKYEYFVSTPDGKRTSTIAHSSQIGNCIGASNIVKDVISGPSLSRFWICQMFPMRSANTDMAEVDAQMRAAALLDRQMLASDNAVHDLRIRQARCYYWEKLIVVGGLTEPTLSTFNIMMPIFRRTLGEQYGIAVPIRTVKRMETFLRTLVIMMADTRAFALPSSPYFRKRFDVRQGKAVDFWLRDSREMVLFVYEFAMDQYVDVQESKVVEWGRALITKRFVETTLFAPGGAVSATVKNTGRQTVYPSAVVAAAASAEDDAHRLHTAATNAVSAQNSTRGDPMINAMYGWLQQPIYHEKTNIAHNSGVKTPGGLDIVKPECQSFYDWNYVYMNMSIDDFAAKLAHEMRHATRPFSAAQVKSQMLALTKRSIASKRFIQNVKFGAPNEPYPVVVDPSDTQPPDKIIAVKCHVGDRGRCFYIASALLFTSWTNPAKEVVRRCMDMYAPAGATYVSGAAFREDTPALFAVNTVVPNPKVIHKFVNAAGLDPATLKWVGGCSYYKQAVIDQMSAKKSGRRLPPWQTEEMFVLNCDIDQFTTRARLCALGLPWDNPALVLRYDIQEADHLWKAAAEHCDQSANYPEDTYKDIVKEDRGRRVRDAIATIPLSKLHEYDVDDAIINDVTVEVHRKRKAADTTEAIAPSHSMFTDNYDDVRSTEQRKAVLKESVNSGLDDAMFDRAKKRHKDAIEKAKTHEDAIKDSELAFAEDTTANASTSTTATTTTTTAPVSRTPAPEMPVSRVPAMTPFVSLNWNKKGDDALRRTMGGDENDQILDDDEKDEQYDTAFFNFDNDPEKERADAEAREQHSIAADYNL